MNTPPLTKPSPATIARISPPWYARAGVWTGVGSAVAGAVVFLNGISGDVLTWLHPFLSPHQVQIATAVCGILAAVTGHLGGVRGTAAAARVAEEATGTPVVGDS